MADITVRLTDVPVETVAAAQQDPASFDPLFEAIHTDLYALCYSILQDHDDAEEVFQEAMLRIYRHLPSLREPASFGAWSIRLVVHACRSLQSKREQLRKVGAIGSGWSANEPDATDTVRLAEPAAKSPGPPELAAVRELRTAVERALAALPPRQREAVLLFELRGLSVVQVAEIMDCSTGAVKFHLHEGRQKLRTALRPLLHEEAIR